MLLLGGLVLMGFGGFLAFGVSGAVNAGIIICAVGFVLAAAWAVDSDALGPVLRLWAERRRRARAVRRP